MTKTNFKEGDRVILTEGIQDLPKGRIGSVVKHLDYFDPKRFCYNPEPIHCLAVKFDSMPHPAVGRLKEGKYVYVVNLCVSHAN